MEANYTNGHGDIAAFDGDTTQNAAESGKVHWTRTPEGRAHMAEVARRRWSESGGFSNESVLHKNTGATTKSGNGRRHGARNKPRTTTRAVTRATSRTATRSTPRPETRSATTTTTTKRGRKHGIHQKDETPHADTHVARARSTARTRASATTERRASHGGSVGVEDTAAAVAFARCDAWIGLYADSWGVPRAALAERVGLALLDSSRGA